MTVSAWLLALGMAASWQEAPQTQPPYAVDEIVVRGVRAEAVARTVEALTEPSRVGQARGQLARWTQPICVQVIGGAPGANRAFASQVASAVGELGLSAATTRCRANVVVVLAEDAEGFARLFAEQRRIGFFANKGEALRAFREARTPVRWAHVVTSRGGGEGAVESAGAASAVNADAGSTKLVDSRLRYSTSEAISRTLLVVDGRRAADVPADALARYVAFAAVTDMPTEHRPADDSILGLFDAAEGKAPREFSRWDRAFVSALYAVSPDRPFDVQRREMVNRMLRDLSGDDPLASGVITTTPPLAAPGRSGG